jgi:hypothetical protein
VGALASDAHDGHRRHLVGQRSHVVQVTGEQPSRLGQRVRRDRDNDIDGVVSASPPEELSGGATDVRGDRVLLDGGKKRVNSRVTTVTPEHLGEGYAAHVDARTDLLSDRSSARARHPARRASPEELLCVPVPPWPGDIARQAPAPDAITGAFQQTNGQTHRHLGVITGHT